MIQTFAWIQILLNALVASFIVLRWQALPDRWRKFLCAIVMLGFPTAIALPVVVHDMTTMKTVSFCLRCHEMHPYGRSLEVDSIEPLSAVHYQNNTVPQGTACYSCHTDYTLFGDFESKLKGLKHMWVHYTGTAPAKLALYQPYNVKNCLHCHGPSKKFRKLRAHNDPGQMEALLSARTSCLECHDVGHALKGAPR